MIYPESSVPITGEMPRALIELRLVGAMMLDDPLNIDLFDKIQAGDFQETILRLSWVFMAELKSTMGEVNINLVCGQFERGRVYDSVGVRSLLEYATSPLFAGVGCDARADWNTLASDRGNVFSLGGIDFLAIGA